MPIIALSPRTEGESDRSYFNDTGPGEANAYVQLGYHSQGVFATAAPNPTQVSTTVGRVMSFSRDRAITVNAIRFFCLGQTGNVTTGQYSFALYVGSTRVWMGPDGAAGTLNTSVGWNLRVPSVPFTIPAGQLCYFGMSAFTAGVSPVAAFRTPVPPIPGVYPLPGTLSLQYPGYYQVSLTGGAWPETLPTLANPAWITGTNTGTMPIFYLES